MRIRSWMIFIVLIIFPVVSSAAEKLVFTLHLIRHGDRTPTISLPAVQYEWQAGLGQLTADGMRQEFEMGERFRKQYIEQTHLLSANYQRTSMYIYSTDYERTLMSAESVLMGLYPPGTGPENDITTKSGLPGAYQPIPIHSAPTDSDPIILSSENPDKEKSLLKKYVYSTVEWQQKEEALKPYFQRWSKLTGLDITKLKHLKRLGDTLFIHRLHHAPMPVGMTENEIDTIITVGDWASMAEKKPKQLANFHSQKLMNNIANFLKNSIEPQSPLRFVLLSAHDSTIASALSFMGAPLSKSPPYASDLNFSLYKNGAANYVVRVSYNGTPVSIPACGGIVCSLDKFLKIAENFDA